MDKQDWYNMGAQIGDLVQSAIDSKDFKELNTTLTNALNATVDSVQKSMQEGIRRAQRQSPKRQMAGWLEGILRKQERALHPCDRPCFHRRSHRPT